MSGELCTRVRRMEETSHEDQIAGTGLALGFALACAGTASRSVKIGVAGPITGPMPPSARRLKNGAEQAVADINAAGGILGQKIERVATATTSPIPSRAFRSPTSSPPTA